MFSVFNYTTLEVQLDRSTRTLRVNLNRPDSENAINLEVLFELESLLAWASNKVEIHSILLSSNTRKFSCGHDKKLLKKQSIKQVETITKKMQTIIQGMYHLPQTIVTDLRDGCNNLASELALGADIRVCSVNANIAFDHAKVGLVPGSGGMAVLSELVGPSIARNMLLSGKNMSSTRLLQSGFIFDTYNSTNREETISELLMSIHQQAPVQRIQSKLGLVDPIRKNIEKALRSDSQISKASLMTEDFKKSNDDRMPSKSMSYAVKLSLVKDNNDLRN